MNYLLKNLIRDQVLLVILTLASFLCGSTLAQAASKLSKEIQTPSVDFQNITGIISESDASRYRVIFKLQENGDWVAADKIVATVQNKVLMGHLLAQRYLHPTKYRSRYKELKIWLDNYGDHPQAEQIYKLALKRRPKNWKLPKKPIKVKHTKSVIEKNNLGYRIYNPRKTLRRAERQKRRQLARRMRAYLRKGWTKSYKNLVRSKETRKLFHTVELDRSRASLAAGYYADGRDQWAYDWASRAILKGPVNIYLKHIGWLLYQRGV